MANLVAIISGATALPEQSVAHLTHDLIGNSGVLDIDGDSFKVAEANPQTMKVVVGVGRAYFRETTMTYLGYATDENEVVIAANNSGNDRISSIVAYLDQGGVVGTQGEGILTFAEVQGTPASSPVAPNSTEIEAALGAGNPYVVLANVRVVNNETSINNADITDMREPVYITFKGGIKDMDLIKNRVYGSVNPLKTYSASSGTVTLDCSKYNNFQVTMNGNITLALSSISAGQFIKIALIQGTGGSRMATWFTTIKWADNVAPTLTTTEGKSDEFVIECTASGQYKGYIVAQNL